MKITMRSMVAMTLAMLAAVATVPGCMSEEDAPVAEPGTQPSEVVGEVTQAAGTCPQSISCQSRHNGYLLREVYKACDAQGDTLSLTCEYYDDWSYTIVPASTSCNECAISTSQGAATCGQWKLTTYANGTCTSGLASHDRGR